MTDPTPIAIASRSFSRHPVLRAETEARYSNATFNDEGVSLRGDALAEFLAGKVKAITALEPIDEELLNRLPDLRLISKVGVGTDMIDFEAAARHGVEVRVTPGTNRRSVAELVIAFAISLLRNVPALRDELRDGGWRQPKGRELSGATVGIVGFGNVGRDVRKLLEPFGSTVLASDVHAIDDADELGIRQVELETLMSEADVVTIHVDLNEGTRNLIDAARIGLMPAGSVLISTARGGVVDESALMAALNDERIAGAAFDVFATEPPDEPELVRHPNFLGTPHIGGSTEEAILAMGRAAIAGLAEPTG